MLSGWFSGEYVGWYATSRSKERIDRLGAHLLTWRYAEPVIRNHFIEWIRFTRDFERRATAVPSVYRSPEVEEYLQRRFPKGSASRLRLIRAPIRLFIEMDESGSVPRRIRKPLPPRNALYEQSAVPYVEYLHLHSGVVERTVEKRAYHLGVFMEFLLGAGVSCLATDLSGELVHDFFCELPRLKPASRLGYAQSIRLFLRWSYLERHLPSDLSGAAMTARQYVHSGLPDVLTEDELEEVISTVDRSYAVGRRDYAVLLLAARYGLRPSDIRRLRLESIDWRGERISFLQSKTGRELTLPLLPDIGEALIDYLRHARPATDSRVIFVRHKAPFEPFSACNNFSPIMRGALDRAGLSNRSGRRGLYLLRSTAATRLLAAGVPFKTIGDILGHATTDSTLAYAKVDLPALRRVALGIEEILS